MGGPAGGIRDRMIQVAIGGGLITAGPATRQIPAANEIGERFRRRIPRLGRRIAGMNQRHQRGRLGQLGHQFGGDQPVGVHLRCRRRARAIDRGRLGDQVNHHRRGRRPLPGRAVSSPTATAQPIGPARQRPQRVRAALLTAARIVLTHGARQRAQPRIEGVGINGEQAATDLAHTVLAFPDPELALGLILLAPPHRIGIDTRHDLIDLPSQPGLGHRGPTRHIGRHRRIHRRQHLGVNDQVGAIHNRGKHQIADITGAKHLSRLRQPLTHRPRIPQPAGRQTLTDPQRRRHLGGHRRHGVHHPLLAAPATRPPIGEQLPQSHQLRRSGPVFGPSRRADPIDERRRHPRGPRSMAFKQLIKMSDRLR